MRGHRRTDPGCRYHVEPRGRIAKWRYNRARGYQCKRCYS